MYLKWEIRLAQLPEELWTEGLCLTGADPGFSMRAPTLGDC